MRAADYTGGAFNNTPANVGLFTFNGNNTLANTNTNYGFRLASDTPARRCAGYGRASGASHLGPLS
ncbi:hypothetical protein D3C81_2318040 [compost metagenome]